MIAMKMHYFQKNICSSLDMWLEKHIPFVKHSQLKQNFLKTSSQDLFLKSGRNLLRVLLELLVC